MKNFTKAFLAVFITGIWINLSESIRWIFLIEDYWIEHYQSMGIELPGEHKNMLIWMIWGFLYASLIYILAKKYSLLHTTIISWSAAFLMLWLVLWNVGVLPTDMLWINMPLSLLETFIAALICKALIKKASKP